MYFMHTVVVENKTEHVQGQVPSNVNLSRSFSSLMFTALDNHFLLLITLDIKGTFNKSRNIWRHSYLDIPPTHHY